MLATGSANAGSSAAGPGQSAGGRVRQGIQRASTAQPAAPRGRTASAALRHLPRSTAAPRDRERAPDLAAGPAGAPPPRPHPADRPPAYDMGLKILIAGGSGYLGQHLCQHLASHGHKVRRPCPARFRLVGTRPRFFARRSPHALAQARRSRCRTLVPAIFVMRERHTISRPPCAADTGRADECSRGRRRPAVSCTRAASRPLAQATLLGCAGSLHVQHHGRRGAGGGHQGESCEGIPGKFR